MTFFSSPSHSHRRLHSLRFPPSSFTPKALVCFHSPSKQLGLSCLSLEPPSFYHNDDDCLLYVIPFNINTFTSTTKLVFASLRLSSQEQKRKRRKSYGERNKEKLGIIRNTKMPSFIKTVGTVVAGLATLASAAPAAPKLTRSQMKIHDVMKRQNAAAAAAGLTDIDILQL